MPEISRNRQNARYAEDTVSVLDFGAVGDGVTDDTAAIQDAIDSLPNGGRVFFPNGTYIVSDTIVMDQPIVMAGESAGFEQIFSGTFVTKGAVIKLADGSFNSSSDAIIEVTYTGTGSEQRVCAKIENIVVDGNRGTASNPTAASATDINSFGIGILASGCRYLHLNNVYCLRCAEDGFKAVTGGTGNVSPNNIQIHQSAFLSNVDDGIDWSGGDSFISNVQCGYNGGDGMALDGGIIVSGARCWDNFTYGCRITGEDTVIDGQFYDNQRSGIIVSGSIGRVVIGHANCQDNGKDTGQTDAVRSGVYISSTASVVIGALSSGNKQENATTGQRYGLRISNASANVSFSAVNEGSVANGVALISDLSRAALTNLTDSTGGTTDGTVASVSGSGADGAINNNFAELVEKVNELQEQLRSHGMME